MREMVVALAWLSVRDNPWTVKIQKMCRKK